MLRLILVIVQLDGLEHCAIFVCFSFLQFPKVTHFVHKAVSTLGASGSSSASVAFASSSTTTSGTTGGGSTGAPTTQVPDSMFLLLLRPP